MGRIYDQLRDVSKITDLSSGSWSSAKELASVIDSLDNVGDVNKLLNMKGVSKDTAEAAVNMSKFANGADAVENLSNATEGLAKNTAEAATSTGKFEGAFKGLASSIGISTTALGILTAALAAGIAAFAIYSAYQDHIQEAVEKAHSSATDLSDRNTNLQDQISKVQELKTALASGTLSEQESYQAKSQLLDIQSQLAESYGDQAEGIDLVNGNLEKELSLMNELAVQDANKYLNENKTGIEKAKKDILLLC